MAKPLTFFIITNTDLEPDQEENVQIYFVADEKELYEFLEVRKMHTLSYLPNGMLQNIQENECLVIQGRVVNVVIKQKPVYEIE